MMTKNKKTALVYAVDLLARQEQSSHRLREKLLRKGYGADEAEDAILRLQKKHYLNDEDACARQFQFLYEDSRNSVKQICAKLMQRGFEGSLVQSCTPEDIYERELKAAVRCLAMKFKPSSDRQKMLANLYGKGFGSEVARKAVDAFLESAE